MGETGTGNSGNNETVYEMDSSTLLYYLVDGSPA
jgi:hypothetical protein